MLSEGFCGSLGQSHIYPLIVSRLGTASGSWGLVPPPGDQPLCGDTGWTVGSVGKLKKKKKCAFLTWLVNKHDRQQKRRKKGRSQCLLFEGTKSTQHRMTFSQKHPILGTLSIVTSERKEISRTGKTKEKVTINSHDKKKQNSKPKNYTHNQKKWHWTHKLKA